MFLLFIWWKNMSFRIFHFSWQSHRKIYFPWTSEKGNACKLLVALHEDSEQKLEQVWTLTTKKNQKKNQKGRHLWNESCKKLFSRCLSSSSWCNMGSYKSLYIDLWPQFFEKKKNPHILYLYTFFFAFFLFIIWKTKWCNTQNNPFL